jgi:hypothetical protein
MDLLNDDALAALLRFLEPSLSVVLVSRRFARLCLTRSWLEPRLTVGLLHAARSNHVDYFMATIKLAPKRFAHFKLEPAVFWAACAAGSDPIVKFIVEKQLCQPSVGKNRGLREAAKAGRVEAVRILLEHPSVDPNCGNMEAFVAVVESKNELFLDQYLRSPRLNLSKAFDVLAMVAGMSARALALYKTHPGKVFCECPLASGVC